MTVVVACISLILNSQREGESISGKTYNTQESERESKNKTWVTLYVGVCSKRINFNVRGIHFPYYSCCSHLTINTLKKRRKCERGELDAGALQKILFDE